MCGLNGLIRSSQAIPPEDQIRRMAGTLRHRGPDDEGCWTAPGIGLGFRRLSIIDRAGGHQPMSTPEGRFTIVFNGEIYNFQALRERLERTGRHAFQTRSDTEVLLHAYQEFGEACVEHLRGMFAFAIYDRDQHTLFAARDRFGKKPFVYAELPGGFAFASELRALLTLPDVSRDIDLPAIDLYLTYQYIPSPRTIFRQIRKLPPAHTLTWKAGQIRIRRYWAPPFLPKTTMPFEDAKRAMMDTLRESVRLRLIADVPLGAFLSGGKDSSAVVGLMSELSAQPVKTFTIGFEEEAFSELPYARTVARHFGTDHQEFIVKPDMLDILPKLAWHYGEPFADSSAVPSYYVAQMTRQHVTVALNGDGGDESLAGYPRYQAMKFMAGFRHVPRPVRKALVALLAAIPDGPPPHSTAWRLRRLFRLGLEDERTTYTDTLCFFRESDKDDLYMPSMRQALGDQFPPDYVNQLLAEAQALSGVDRYLKADQQSYLPECLMTKMDIASMASSLEARSPLLDHLWVEQVSTFPSAWKLKGLTHPKHIFNEALKGWLPASILHRPKQGFALPMSHWLRGKLQPHLESMLLSRKALARGLFHERAIRRLLDENSRRTVDRSYALWALLMLEHWFQAYIDPA